MDNVQRFEIWKKERQEAGLCYTQLNVHFNNCIMRVTCDKPFGHDGMCEDSLDKGNFVKPGTVDHVPYYAFKQKFQVFPVNKEILKEALDVQEKMSHEKAIEYFKTADGQILVEEGLRDAIKVTDELKEKQRKEHFKNCWLCDDGTCEGHTETELRHDANEYD